MAYNQSNILYHMQEANPKYIKIPVNFKECYLKLCEDRKVTSTSKSLASSPSDSCKININADRIKLGEWEVICSALSMENTLKRIHIFSKRHNRDWPTCILEDANTSLLASGCQGPVVFTRYVMEKLVRSLSQSLARPESTCEELVIHLPLDQHYCMILSQGLQAASDLQHISLSGSCIGDEGCCHLCESLKTMQRIRVLDLSDCKLGVKAIESLVTLISSHSLMRASEAWKNSFRYRSPTKDMSIGLLRLTLNKNPGIGDVGVKKLIKALTDDSWIKALDLQMCNIGNEGAVQLLSMLPENLTIAIIDIRGNRNVCRYLTECMEKALERDPRRNTDLQWLPFIPTPKMKALLKQQP